MKKDLAPPTRGAEQGIRLDVRAHTLEYLVCVRRPAVGRKVRNLAETKRDAHFAEKCDICQFFLSKNPIFFAPQAKMFSIFAR